MKKTVAPLNRKKSLRGVTTRNYIGGMKAKASSALRGEEAGATSSVVQEIMPIPGVGASISVRAAKAHLSGLLDEVAAGREVVITSDGVPKARLVPMSAGTQRKPFSGTREHLKSMPKWKMGDLTADEIIRADRDGRGW
jgi:prevent-host-death family protein